MKKRAQALSLLLGAVGTTRRKLTLFQKVGTGHSNDTYCAVVEGKTAYQVRLGNGRFGLDRKAERAVMDAVGLSCLSFNEQTGDFVRSWIKGETVHKWTDRRIERVARAMREIHKTKPPVGVASFNPFLYEGKVKIDKFLAKKYRQIVEKYGNDDYVLCHNDVNGDNVVEGEEGKLTLIDYEWSSLNSPYWDLANFIREEGLSTYQINLLVASYGGGIVMPKLYDFIFLAACYGRQWSLAMPFGMKIFRQRLKTKRTLMKAMRDLNMIF